MTSSRSLVTLARAVSMEDQSESLSEVASVNKGRRKVSDRDHEQNRLAMKVNRDCWPLSPKRGHKVWHRC